MSKIKGGISQGKDHVSQMRHVLFTGRDLVTYNENVAILYPFGTDFNVSVRHDDLYKLVTSTFSEEDLSLELNEKGDQLLVSAGKTTAGLSALIENELTDKIDALVDQLPSDDNTLKWSSLPEKFVEGAQLCLFAASTDKEDFHHACLYVDKHGAVCTDGMRASWYKFKEGFGRDEFMIYATDVSILSDFEIVDYYISDSWVNFVTADDVVICFKVLVGKKLDYVKSFFKNQEGAELTLVTELKAGIDSMIFMADGDTQSNKAMDISIKKDMLICNTETDRGWVNKEIDIEYAGDEIDLCINPIFLSQILATTTKAIVGKDRTWLSTGAFQHAIMHRSTAHAKK